MDKKIASPQINENQPLDNTYRTAEADRMTILNYLKKNRSLTTLQARAKGLMSPAPRVLELRRKGHKIITNWCVESDASGRTHRVAEYVLMPSQDN